MLAKTPSVRFTDESIAYEQKRHTERVSQKEQAQALFNTAKMHMKQGRYVKAIEATSRAIHISPSIRLLEFRANLYIQTHQFSNAEKDYEKILRINPKSEVAHRGLCTLYHMTNQSDKELSALYRAINAYKSGAKKSTFFELRGDYYLHHNDYFRAITSYDEAIALNPSAALYIKRGKIRLERHIECHLAAEDFRCALRLIPEHPEATVLLKKATPVVGEE